MTLDDLKKLTPVELDFIAAHIYKLVKDKVTEDTKNEENFNHDPDCCPHCGSLSFIKYGFNKGKQKYYCKDCNKFFSKTTGTLYHRSENEYVVWKNFMGVK
jgi:transposase-like protein